jgi:metal-responsive CopG/Arc/MetJ family transcriptional regulator
MNTTHISLRVNSQVLEQIDEDAAKQRRSRSFIIDDILAEYYKPTKNGTKPTPTQKKAGTR